MWQSVQWEIQIEWAASFDHPTSFCTVCAQSIRGLNFRGLRGPWTIREYFNPANYWTKVFRNCWNGSRAYTRAQCPILLCIAVFSASVGPNIYHQRVVAYHLLIWLSWWEMSNDTHSFLIPVKQCDLPELETVVSSFVVDAWQVARALVNRRYLELLKKNGCTAFNTML